MPLPASPPAPSNPDDAPGAVPPTGGVPPEDAGPAAAPADTRPAADDLADGIDLMLRAARKALRSVDPGIEAAAAQAVTRLQELDSKVLAAARENLGAEQRKLEQLAGDMGRDISAILKRVAERIDANWREPR
jgi:hypothetical protein